MKRDTILGAVLLALLAAVASPLHASEEVAEQMSLECAVCHQESDEANLLLTDQGKYYQLMETLEGFDLVMEQFGHCNYCHVPEAGSKALTREGLRFEWMMEDMTGLRQWLEDAHPKPAEKSSATDSEPAESPAADG